MNRLIRYVTVVACCLFLASCGGPEEDGAVKAQGTDTDKKHSDHMLSSQQQAIEDAKSIQGILDKDSEEKKAALDSAE